MGNFITRRVFKSKQFLGRLAQQVLKSGTRKIAQWATCCFFDSLSKQKKRIIYTIMELSPLLDSSNMTPAEWDKIARHLEKYDGFVILHGTDTMAYTAAALSFMCENLGKTIVLTGSQVPIYELRNDGRANLLGALLIAGLFVIPEVCLYFYNKLYRGNRVIKVDADSFNAFSSPNLPPLANAEVDITNNIHIIWVSEFQLWHRPLNSNCIYTFSFVQVKAFLQSPMEGVVLETYGSGNAPNNRPDLLDELKKATDRNVVILNCTQCLRGTVSSAYATGKTLRDAGVIPGADMTPEAALAKLSYVLSKPGLTMNEKRKVKCSGLLKSVIFISSHSIGGASPQRRPSSCETYFRCMIDFFLLKELILLQGGNLSSGDYDGRTPLHIACCEGNLEMVRHLLQSGATVYAKDRLGATPLMNAVKFRREREGLQSITMEREEAWRNFPSSHQEGPHSAEAHLSLSIGYGQ
uniref:asparaginase n=1 Tax=Varanus komodoensis TaxID=61221 RepID=A0A8D2J6X4_VARKO